MGPGEWSLDNAFDWFQPPGWLGLGITLVAGIGGAAGLLVMFCRPPARSA